MLNVVLQGIQTHIAAASRARTFCQVPVEM